MSVTRWQQLLGIYWAAMAIATHWPRIELPGPEYTIWQTDKMAHLVCFAVLTLLLIRAMGSRIPHLARAVLALCIVSAYAVLDEWTQQFVERSASRPDLVASLLGALTVGVLVLTPRSKPEEPGWLTTGARVLLGVSLPTFLLVAILPDGNRTYTWLVGLFTRPWHGMDKPGHFWLGICLTWLLAASAPLGVRRPRAGSVLTIAALGLGAPLLEMVQARTGRGVEIEDVYMHNLGLLAAMAGWSVLLIVKNLLPTNHLGQDGSPARFVGHAVLIGSLTLVSRITGLLRDVALAAAFGAREQLDAFFIGFLVPNLFRRLFGEGALTAAFIPRYTRLLAKDPQLAGRFATLCIAALAAALAGVTLLSEAAITTWLSFLDPGTKTAQALQMTALMLPYMPIICLVALGGAVLQVRRHFGPPATVPIVLNLCLIAAAGIPAAMRRGPEPNHAIKLVAASVLVAGVIQLIWIGAAILHSGRLPLRIHGAKPAFGQMLRVMVPMILGLAVFQINVLLDDLIAFAFSASESHVGPIELFGWSVEPPIKPGAVTTLTLAQRLYQFPLGVFGIAISTAIFPALSKAAIDKTPDHFGQILRQGLRLSVFVGLPASAGLILIRQPLARIMFEHGQFEPEATQRVAQVLAGYASAVWAYSTAHLLTRAFYARDDALTPVWISTAMVGLNLILNLVLIWPLQEAGLAWSSAICATGQVALLLLFGRRHVDRIIDAQVLRSWLRVVWLTAAMAVVIGVILRGLDPDSLTKWGCGAAVAICIVIGATMMLGGARLTGAEELSWLRRR